MTTTGPNQRCFTDLGVDILRPIVELAFKGDRRDRVILPWRGESRCDMLERRLFPGPPSENLLGLASMHSLLAEAARPLIWREVSVAFGSDSDTDYKAHLKGAMKPENARHVRAFFVSYSWFGNDEKTNRVLAKAVQKFTGLRAICMGGFQGHSQFSLDKTLAKAIRDNSRIDTIVLGRMQKSADIVNDINARRIRSLDLEICHGGTVAAIQRPLALTYLCHEQVEPVKVASALKDALWNTLIALGTGRLTDFADENEGDMIKSLNKFIAGGGKPALQSLYLGRFSQFVQWREVARDIPLQSLRYTTPLASLHDLKYILKAWPQLRRLHIDLPPQGKYQSWHTPLPYDDDDSDDEAEEEFEDEEEDEEDDSDEDFVLRYDPKMIPQLARLANLERLVFDVPISFSFFDEVLEDEEIGEDLVLDLANSCPKLQSVQLDFYDEEDSLIPSEAREFEIYHVIGEDGQNKVELELVAPRLLEETALAFLEK
ncbi:hypothetical protein Hypma_001503 [Hypsizygus marmoreus]|uniref:Uncharacterized protein n=1 Tax=Hypsizygus marmoreus TaxID=39966 RepID=A0A369K942_HYPMA|nr:hypothetical protein Hypma_001503 [Hypsizygus marmoreus]